MNCNEAENLLSAHADGELDGLRQHAIEKHLRTCGSCAAKHQDVLALRERVHAEAPYFGAPPELRLSLRARFAGARPTVRTRFSQWRWFASGALAGCIATLLVWASGIALWNWRANEDVAVEAVASHVRATLNNHLLDVASSDTHTVKPWLSARLDYSPPVQDFASEGFPLQGGRIDTLDKEPVATLVYRYRLHNIDVFVRPAFAHAPTQARALRGFNIAHASAAGMDWLAVSDVSPDVLQAFVQRLAQQGGSR